MSSNHVYHLLTAYVHHQLPRAERNRVLLHLQTCPDCWMAMERESQLVHELQAHMPGIGQPERNQLARLWPAIWAEFKTAQTRSKAVIRWSSYGMALALMVLVGIFVTSALFNNPVPAMAAPVQAQPSDVRATWTPVFTEEPITSGDPGAKPSLTADAAKVRAVDVRLMASPVPVAASGVISVKGANWR